MRSVPATWILVATVLFSAGTVTASESDKPREMLERMNAAMSQMSYQGTFVYVQGDAVETMRITHVAGETGVRERLVAVSGPPREVLRDSNGVRWVLGDNRSVFEDTAFDRPFFPKLPFDQHDRTKTSYSLKKGSEARIAGHNARNLIVLPRDEYRYGYSLWLEEHSGLLLKWELIDGDGKALAKLMFTDLRLGSEVDPAELKPSSQLKKFKTVESKLPAGHGLFKTPPRWQPGKLPPGFQLTAHRYSAPDDSTIYEHLVYSDGLAAVSVYVENIPADSTVQTGPRQLGTTHAFSRVSDHMMITVVGEVPATTVKLIGDTVKLTAH